MNAALRRGSRRYILEVGVAGLVGTLCGVRRIHAIRPTITSTPKRINTANIVAPSPARLNSVIYSRFGVCIRWDAVRPRQVR